ncbi:MAG: glycerophosphodiester phosphodiesterase family protein [Lentisphaerae bacterium]|nr:glycerophosphodiester phosphodiesterase family protein [Lentisphaerota bacterium]
MKKRMLVLTLVFAVLGCFAETLPLKGKVVWQTDFSDETGVPKGWLVEGGIWNVENGELVGKATTYRSVIQGPESLKLTNFAMECDATVLARRDDLRWFTLMLRCNRSGKDGYVQLMFRYNMNTYSGCEFVNSWMGKKERQWELLQRFKIDWCKNFDDTRRIRCEVQGRRMRGFLNGKFIGEHILPSINVHPGSIGFMNSDCTVKYDNVVVEELPEPDANYLDGPRDAAIAVPLCVAHRGDMERFPENTLEAVKGAIEMGFDYIEIDLRMSKDGVVFLLHDDTLERTTNGTGQAKLKTMAELKELDAGIKRNKKFEGMKIPTFEEVCQAMPPKGKCMLMLDIKQSECIKPALEMMKKYGLEYRVIVGTWNLQQADLARAALPGVPVLLNSGKLSFTDAELRTYVMHGVGAVAPSTYTALPLSQARRHTLQVFTWAQNSPIAIRKAILFGADAITTDYPSVLKCTYAEYKDEMFQ